MLSTVAYHLMRRGVERERAVSLALRSLERIARPRGARAFFYATTTLDVGGEIQAAAQAYDAAIDRARRRGDVLTASASLLFRGIAALRWGNLGGAEDLRESIGLGGFDGAPYQAAFLAELLIEQELERPRCTPCPGCPSSSPSTGTCRSTSTAAPASATRRPGTTTRCGTSRRWDSTSTRSGSEPGLRGLAHTQPRCSPRSSGATKRSRWRARSSSSRGSGTSRAIASASARSGSPSGERAVQTLRQAAGLLDETPARLEEGSYAIDLGVAEQRVGERDEARAHLRRGLELAELARATRLADQARMALTATGVRPRPVVVGGIESLTTSLAARGRAGARGPDEP